MSGPLSIETRTEALRRVLTTTAAARTWEFSLWEDQPDGEPRIWDLDAAERLSFTRPRDIRKLIERIWPEGKRPCVRATVARTQMPRGGVSERSVREYWLTEAQLLKVIARSATPVAETILDEMISVYMAVRRHLASTVPVVAHARRTPKAKALPASQRAMELANSLAARTGTTSDEVLSLVLDRWAEANDELRREGGAVRVGLPMRTLLVLVQEGTYQALEASLLADGLTPRVSSVSVIAGDVLTGHAFLQRAFCGLGSRGRKGPNWLSGKVAR